MDYDIYLFAYLLTRKSPWDGYGYVGRWDRDLGPAENPSKEKSARVLELEHALLDYLRALRVELNNRFYESSAWKECEEIPGDYCMNFENINVKGNIYDLYAAKIPRR